jgi:hypothetical protein
VRTRTWTALMVAATLVAACAAGDGPTVDDLPPNAADGQGATPVDLPRCPTWDAPREYDPPAEQQPTPDPALTGAEPVPDLPTDAEPEPDLPTTEEPGTRPAPGSSVPPIEAARSWAASEAREHFAGVWLDDDHGAAVIAFTDHVDAYATEVRERFGAGWWVVAADHTEAELEAAQRGVIARMGGDGSRPGDVVGSGIRTDRGVVTVEVVGGDGAVLGDLAAQLDHPAICFEVLDPPPTYDVDGAVRTLATVTGWRDGLDHPGYGLLEIASDRETGERAFAENVPDGLARGGGSEVWDPGLHADLSSVDWDREAIVVWSAGRSGSCPEWVSDVTVEGGTVRVRTASPSQGACTSDYNAYRAVLAVDRDRLPEAGDLPMPVNEGFPEGSEARDYPG